MSLISSKYKTDIKEPKFIIYVNNIKNVKNKLDISDIKDIQDHYRSQVLMRSLDQYQRNLKDQKIDFKHKSFSKSRMTRTSRMAMI